jgi:hypothetical protein
MKMSPEPTDDDLHWLLGECEIALSTVRRTIDACPSDLVAKVALPRHLADDVQGWLEGVNDRPLGTAYFDRLSQFVRQSKLSIIDPQAQRIGLKISKLKPAERHNNLSPYSTVYIFILFVTQGLTFVVLDRLQTSPPWAGNPWMPHVANLVATYVLVLHHQASWIPTLCYLAAQGLCVRVGNHLHLGGILGLLLILASIVASAPPMSMESRG